MTAWLTNKYDGGDFMCRKNIRDLEITRDELQKAFKWQGDEPEFIGRSIGRTYKTRMINLIIKGETDG